MRQGSPNAPPPQIDLASLFPNPVPTPSGPYTSPDCQSAPPPHMNLASPFPSSVNATMQHMSRTPSAHVGQQSPSIYQQGGVDMSSVNVMPRQMNGSSFEHRNGQALPNPYQQDGTGNNSVSVDLQRMDGSTFRYIAPQNNYQQESMQNSSSNVLERMCATSIRNQGTPTANYHSRHTRVGDTTDDEHAVFF
ncbi:unnamed protein product [Urochloa decumbens]|uniref:Uncharacterized protein n=1 Tax=Urochloa decumbens TaxID=240449 RepID=A0ABC9D874_9POAL